MVLTGAELSKNQPEPNKDSPYEQRCYYHPHLRQCRCHRTQHAESVNTGQSKKSESRKGWSAERWRELCEGKALREA